MTDEELIALEWNLPKFRAREDLREYNAGRMQFNGEGIYKLAMRAWDDEELANEYRLREEIAAMNRRKGSS